jgi:hypothetical protein
MKIDNGETALLVFTCIVIVSIPTVILVCALLLGFDN